MDDIIEVDPEERKVNALRELEAKAIEQKKKLMQSFTIEELRNTETRKSIAEKLEAIDAEYNAHYDWFLNPLKQ